jgi:hypothetical protein
MKRYILGLLTLVSLSMSANASCDFSGITFKTLQQRGNDFYFQTNMHMDSCWYYTFTAYSHSNDEEYKLDNNGGWTGVTFNQKGKYEVRLNVFNECEKCDTTFTIDVDITIFDGIGFKYNVGAKNCKYYQFEMMDRKDTCYEYYYQLYKGDDWINGLSDKEWKQVSDSSLYFDYSFDDSLLMYYSKESERTLTHEFTDTGRYLMISMVYNKCTQIDTWAFQKLNVCTEFNTLSTKPIIPIEEQTIVGIYDLMGRLHDEMEVGIIYVVLYSDGRRMKVMRTQ